MPSDHFLLPVLDLVAFDIFPIVNFVIVIKTLRIHVIPLLLDVNRNLLQAGSNSMVVSMMLGSMMLSQGVVVSSSVGGGGMLSQGVVVSSSMVVNSGVSIDFYDSLLTSLGFCISKVTWLFNFI